MDLRLDHIPKIAVLNEKGDIAKWIVFDTENESFRNTFGGQVEIVFSKQRIHADDSIRELKMKIIQELGTETPIAYEEIYLFGVQETTVHLRSIFESITQESTITSAQFGQILILFDVNDTEIVDSIEAKDRYTFDDLLSLRIEGTTQPFKYPFGKQFARRSDYMFLPNPFDIPPKSEFIPTYDNPLISFENHVVLNYPSPRKNTIYMTMAEDVFRFAQYNDIDEVFISRIYFPMLYKNGVFSAADLASKKDDLLEKTVKMITKTVVNSQNAVSVLYDIYRLRTEEIAYLQQGVYSFSFMINPLFAQVLPLEPIFKNVHSSKEHPYIRFNPGTRRENIYRFYTEQITHNGSRIPFLGKNHIMAISKTVERTKNILFYLPISLKQNEKVELYVSIHSNGNMNVYGNLDIPLNLEDLNTLVESAVSPIIQEINDFLGQSSYQIRDFTSIYDENVEVLYAKYRVAINVENKVKLPTYWGVLRHVFESKTKGAGKIENGIQMRYKRVENYEDMNAGDATITEILKQTDDKREIIALLMARDESTEDQAVAKMVEYFNKYTKIEGRYVNRNEDIVENPGFPVKFYIEPFENKMYVIIENITGLKYIPCLEKYIDSIIRITQKPKTTEIPISKILEYSTKEELLKSQIANIIIAEPAEKPLKRIIAPVQLGRNVSEDYDDEVDDDGEKVANIRESEDGKYEDGDEHEEGIFFYPSSSDSDSDSEKEEYDNESLKSDVELDVTVLDEKENSGIFMPFDDSEYSSQSSSSLSSSSSPIIINTTNVLVQGAIDDIDDKSDITGGGRTKGSKNKNVSSKVAHLLDKKESNKESKALEPIEYAEEEEEEQNEQQDTNAEKYKKQLDGQPLKNRNSNIFLKRMKDREPTLFLTQSEGNFDNYSRICPYNMSRQPVILTTEEKERIDREHPGSYTNSISYGTDPSKPYHYICPRYWCLLTQSPMSESEVEESMRMEREKPGSSKCGKIIPEGKTEVPPGHYIYEFKNAKQHIDKKTGKYIENSPGFITDSHPKGHCLPCCFKSTWNAEDQVKRRKKCAMQGSENELEPELKPDEKNQKSKKEKQGKVQQTKKADKSNKNEKEEKNEKPQFTIDVGPSEIVVPTVGRQTSAAKDARYILGIDKYVLPQNRWGYLPLAAQYFLQTDNSLAVNPNNPALIKEGIKTPPLLRYGIENSMKKSFVAVLCVLYHIAQKTPEVPTIKEMCETILPDAIQIDQFIQYHNGALVQGFAQNTKIPIPDDNYTDEKYTDSEFVQSVDTSNESQLHFLVHTVAAFENFIAFLKNPDSEISHYFLWDICAMPNIKIFPQGINVAIMQIEDNDITDNIGLLCPANAYSSQFYSENKPTAIVLKRDEFYEPIFLYDKKELFVDGHLTEGLKDTLHIIRGVSKSLCSPQPSIPFLYLFKQNHIGSHITTILVDSGYTIKSQVLNYRGKTIGVVLEDPVIFIPVFPGAPLPNYPKVYMDNDTPNEIWQPYEKTRDSLIAVYQKTARKVWSRPIAKVDEDGLVVGILTETNQFVKVTDPSAPVKDNLKIVKGMDYISADKILETTNDEDRERVETVRKIRLEEEFYSAFRTTIQNILKDINHRDARNELVKIIEKEAKPMWMYRTRLQYITELLQRIAKDHIEFVLSGKSFDFLESFDEIRSCTNSPNQPSYCVIVDGKSKILLPKKHLYANPNGDVSDNEELYFYRLADELLRFKRIQFFMLEPNMKVPQTSYRVNSDEMIMLQSLLTSDYFAGLIPFRSNAKITYTTANPIISQNYSNIVTTEEQKRFSKRKDVTDAAVNTSNCITGTQPLIGNIRTFWKQVFPKETQEFVYDQTENCTFQIVLDILSRMKNRTEEQKKIGNITVLRNFLADRYKALIEGGVGVSLSRADMKHKIQRIMRYQGKRSIVERAKKVADFTTIVLSEDYYLTSLDLWVLSDALDLPIVLFGPSKLSDLEYADWSVHWIIANHRVREHLKDPHFYIRIPVRKTVDFIPRYSLVTSPFKFADLKGMEKIVLEGLEPSNEFSRHQFKLADYLIGWNENNIPKAPVEL